MAVDLRKIKKLIELVEESGIAELEVASGDESVRIAMHRGVVAVAPSPVVGPSATDAPAADTVEVTPGGAAQYFEAPMAGTFYRAPNPEAAPFVDVGDSVEVGQVLCIVESMKMMHEVKSTMAGTVAQICVANGAAIGTGERLFRLS